VTESPRNPPSRSTATEALRARALTDIELLLQSAEALRTQLRTFEAGMRSVRKHLERGAHASELHDVLDITEVRETLTRAAVEFEAARKASRLAVFRMQQAEGMSIGAIARAWGFSRQLVSRMMKEAGANGSSAG
jgi:hypothetical protein